MYLHDLHILLQILTLCITILYLCKFICVCVTLLPYLDVILTTLLQLLLVKYCQLTIPPKPNL